MELILNTQNLIIKKYMFDFLKYIGTKLDT